jgi:aconitase B
MLLLQKTQQRFLKLNFSFADTARLEALKSGNEIAKEILESYAKTEFTKLQ